MKAIDLFSGIGGFALACRWTGIETVQFVEINQRCRDFLSRAWPGVAIHDDVRTFHYSGRPVFLLTGGVPCQPASRAGKQRGAEDNRWLWPEAVRVLAEVNPTWALFENPPGIGDVGLSGILSDVEACNYEVRVIGIPACAVGSPQIRMRYWIVAHRTGERYEERGMQRGISGQAECRGEGEAAFMGTQSQLADHNRDGQGGSGRQGESIPQADTESLLADAPRRQDDIGRDGNMAEAEGCGRGSDTAAGGVGGFIRDTESSADKQEQCFWSGERTNTGRSVDRWDQFIWLPCADGKVRRAPDNSFSLVDGLHRSVLGALGNSIVPQVAYWIIKAMVDAEQEGKNQ